MEKYVRKHERNKKMKVLKGDIFKSSLVHIAHGVNCQGVMNSGIAKQIRQLYPIVYESFMNIHEAKADILGTVTVVQVDNRFIYNIYTQEFYGRDRNKVYVNYTALTSGLIQCVKHVIETTFFEPAVLGIPWIGCGLANGNRSDVKDILLTIEKITNLEYPEKRFEFLVYELGD